MKTYILSVFAIISFSAFTSDGFAKNQTGFQAEVGRSSCFATSDELVQGQKYYSSEVAMDMACRAAASCARRKILDQLNQDPVEANCISNHTIEKQRFSVVDEPVINAAEQTQPVYTGYCSVKTTVRCH